MHTRGALVCEAFSKVMLGRGQMTPNPIRIETTRGFIGLSQSTSTGTGELVLEAELAFACANSILQDNSTKSTSQNALYSTIDHSGGGKVLPKITRFAMNRLFLQTR